MSFLEGRCIAQGTPDRPPSNRSLRANGRLDLAHRIRRETALAGVLADDLLIGRFVHTVDLVAGHVAVQPLDVRTEAPKNVARFLGDALQIVLAKIARTGDGSLDNV